MTANERKVLLEKLVLTLVGGGYAGDLVTHANGIIDQMDRYHTAYDKAEAKEKTV